MQDKAQSRRDKGNSQRERGGEREGKDAKRRDRYPASLLEGEPDELLERMVGRNTSSVVVEKTNRRAEEYRLSQERVR
jgi:hypothetical protein